MKDINLFIFLPESIYYVDSVIVKTLIFRIQINSGIVHSFKANGILRILDNVNLVTCHNWLCTQSGMHRFLQNCATTHLILAYFKNFEPKYFKPCFVKQDCKVQFLPSIFCFDSLFFLKRVFSLISKHKHF